MRDICVSFVRRLSMPTDLYVDSLWMCLTVLVGYEFLVYVVYTQLLWKYYTFVQDSFEMHINVFPQPFPVCLTDFSSYAAPISGQNHAIANELDINDT